VAQVVKPLPSKFKAPSSNPSTTKTKVKIPFDAWYKKYENEESVKEPENRVVWEVKGIRSDMLEGNKEISRSG
jgi:hypothetical protein